MAQNPYALSDDDLKKLAADPRMTPEVEAKLSPTERHRYQQFKQVQPRENEGRIDRLLRVSGDVTRGTLKGAGETAYGAGSLVHRVPGVGSTLQKIGEVLGPAIAQIPGSRELTDYLYPSDVGAAQAFEQPPPGLKAANTAEELGKVAENVAEYYVPGMAATSKTGKAIRASGQIPFNAPQRAVTSGLATLIPGRASPRTIGVLNRLASILGRAGGEAGTAAAVSALHGEDRPEREALAAGGSVLGGELLTSLLPLLKTRLGMELGPLVAAGAVGSWLPDLGLGGSLGTWGTTRAIARHTLKSPQAIERAQRGVRRVAIGAGRTAAATEAVRRRQQREQE